MSCFKQSHIRDPINVFSYERSALKSLTVRNNNVTRRIVFFALQTLSNCKIKFKKL